MPILRLKPVYKDNLWGGRRLVEEYNKDFDGPVLAESWEVSCYPGSPSIIAEGEYEGLTLEDYISNENPDAIGTAGSRFAGFPLMVKLIDARESLSVQVHPSDGYSYANEGQPGKLEVWYIMDAEPGAFIYYGLKRRVKKEELRRHIENHTLTEILYKAPANKGDVFFIEHGVLHAIGAGVMVLEVEQNSNVTYRVYDYGRRGADGKERELHVDKALDVVQLKPVRPVNMHGHLAECEYFIADRITSGLTHSLKAGSESFVTVTFMEGSGMLNSADGSVRYRKGDSFFIPAGTGEVQIEGEFDAITARI